ncbi:hypothetical protein [Burkholderia sp. A2]|uniref:hypothetical protein n=1 Tax=Burkholderia sp. A2 TaxID=236253 RepID=UPI00159F14A4|nr:hypothetical protein [Burkholderia sp. A2]
MRENHATTRERAIGKGRYIVSLRMGFIFCFRESTSIHADESIAPLAGAGGSDKSYLFFVDFRYRANRPPDSMLSKPTGFPENRACGPEAIVVRPAFSTSHKFFFRLAQHILDCWRPGGSG